MLPTVQEGDRLASEQLRGHIQSTTAEQGTPLDQSGEPHSAVLKER